MQVRAQVQRCPRCMACPFSACSACCVWQAGKHAESRCGAAGQLGADLENLLARLVNGADAGAAGGGDSAGGPHDDGGSPGIQARGWLAAVGQQEQQRQQELVKLSLQPSWV
jgi:hypothetical protein